MKTLHLPFNAVTVIFIAVTMFAAGVGSTLAALRTAVTNVPCYCWSWWPTSP